MLIYAVKLKPRKTKRRWNLRALLNQESVTELIAEHIESIGGLRLVNMEASKFDCIYAASVSANCYDFGYHIRHQHPTSKVARKLARYVKAEVTK